MGSRGLGDKNTTGNLLLYVSARKNYETKRFMERKDQGSLRMRNQSSQTLREQKGSE
jgi:hypothetical protein